MLETLLTLENDASTIRIEIDEQFKKIKIEIRDASISPDKNKAAANMKLDELSVLADVLKALAEICMANN